MEGFRVDVVGNEWEGFGVDLVRTWIGMDLVRTWMFVVPIPRDSTAL